MKIGKIILLSLLLMLIGHPAFGQSITLVTLGDSLTEGDGDDGIGGGYPARLLSMLQAPYPGSTLNNLGISGDISDALINKQLEPAVNLLNAAPAGNLKIALIWIGSNDLFGLYNYVCDEYYGNNYSACEGATFGYYSDNITTILTSLKATGSQIYIALLDDQSRRPVMTDPVLRVESFPLITDVDVSRMSTQVSAYNDEIARLASTKDATMVDFFSTTIFENWATLSGDGNHPNGVGYDAIATIWYQAITGSSTPTIPTVTTTAASSVTTTSASSGGNITSDGGASVTARGVCWSTSANPTTANSKTTDGTGTDSFTSLITGLSSGTPYHVRAYATNSQGTSYGSDVTFTTSTIALSAPTLTVTTSGTTVSLSWTSVAGATGYTLYYAPFPYTGPESIKSIPMGNKTSISASLPDGSAFYVALQAYDGFGSSGYSNIEHFIIDTSATYTNSLGQTFILLPAGTFTMGSPSSEPGSDDGERPQHQVTLTQSFYMQQTEVTQAQWEAVMGSNPSGFSGCATCPVEQVSWDDAQDYIVQMNLRGEGTYDLPTEAQWEYAYRAGSTTAFYNGAITETGSGYDPNLDAIGWYTYNSDSETHPVAQKTPNAWGLYDMSGNVWEWCQDWFSESYYDSSPPTDPAGPSSGSYRVIRGGSWYFGSQGCRAANRDAVSPGNRVNDIGFRLVLSPGQQ